VRIDPAEAVARAHAEHWARLLALLVARLRRLDVAEDALAEAYAAAVRTWPRAGVPDHPERWLLTTARHKAYDLLRHEEVVTRKLPLLVTDEAAPAADEWVDDDVSIPDERLRLLFTCCHPALSLEARVALTLRMVGGLTTAEIARAFLVPEPTMGQRISRAKKKIATAGIPYRVPSGAELPARMSGVLAVLYLVFTEGYAASSGTGPVRADLAAEAIRLTRLTAVLMPDEPEVAALLALMLLQHSRRDTRVDADGELVLLPAQDRSRWHADEIAEGLRILTARRRSGGSYGLQARIAAEHARAARATDTDWDEICRLYEALDRLTGSPVVRLNRAVAIAERSPDGAEEALGLLTGLDDEIGRSHLFWSARAELLHRLGRDDEAAADYERAYELAGTDAERRLLAARREELRRA
jgi:RNA polymerase sigma-70 factor, ECF subfamily